MNTQQLKSLRPGKLFSLILDVAADFSRVPYLNELRRSRNMPNAVFIWIPKTAGTSLFSSLDALNASRLPKLRYVKYRFSGRGTVTFGHMDYAQLVAEGHVSKAFDDSAYKFAFVRNPYARAVSLYAYLKRRRILPADESFLSFCRRLRQDGCEPIGLYNTHGFNQCNCQVRWIEKVEIDQLGRLESLAADVEIIFKKLGLDGGRVPMLNPTDHAPYQDYFCSESKEIIEDFYGEDFRAFDYEHEDF